MDTIPAPDLWNSWLAQNASKFFLYARQQARSEADAEDILQESLVESWQRGGQANQPPAAALVFATIRRRAIDFARSADRRAKRELDHGVSAARWFTISDGAGSIDLELEDAVKGLPEIYREVITLKVWGELTFAEIADVLKLSPNTAASRYRYGIDHLRQVMKAVAP